MGQRIISVIFGLIGLGFILSGFQALFEDAIDAVMPLLLGSVALFSAFLVWRAVSLFEEAQRRRAEQTFEWYKKEYPESCSGRIKCRSCSGDRISVRRLMNQTYFNAHVCNTCGTTLYFSPES